MVRSPQKRQAPRKIPLSNSVRDQLPDFFAHSLGEGMGRHSEA